MNLLHGSYQCLAVVRPEALLIVGEGPARQELESLRDRLGLAKEAVLLGARSDVESVVASFDCG